MSRKWIAGRCWVGLSPKNNPLKSAKTGVTKLAFIYVKRAKAKNNVISYLGVPRVGPTESPMQAILSEALPLTATPKKIIQKWAPQLTLIYVKAPRLKKQCHILCYGVLRIRNDQCKHFKCGFTPDSNPKMGKKGKQNWY